MAMKPYGQTFQTWCITYDRSNGSTQVMRRVGTRSLGDVFTKKGNYRTPNNHSYRSVRSRGYIGSTKTYAGGRLQRSVTGSQPFPFSYTHLFPAGFEGHALTAALSDAYEKLRGNVDLSVDLVQWRQTLKMVSLYRRLVSGIAKSAYSLIPKIDNIKSLKRDLSDPQLGKRRARRLTRELNRATNALARARLEYTYGWSPTMSTIYEFAHAAANPPGGGFLVCEGKGNTEYFRRYSRTSISSKVPTVAIVRISERARVKLLYRPPNGVLSDMAKISSLNPVSLLYEATPFSFVLDWAVDVGEWIRILETAFIHRNEFISGDQTITQRCTISDICAGVDYLSIDNFKNGNFTVLDLTGIGVQTRLARTGLSSPPVPINPQKQFKFGVGRQLNALALAKVVLLDADNLIAGRRR